MTTIYNETYGALAAGTVLTDANTVFDDITGSGTFTAIADGITGSAGRFATSGTSALKQAGVEFAAETQLARRFYLRVPAGAPPSNIAVYDLKSGSTRNAQIRVTTALKLQIRSLDVAVDIADTPMVIGDWYRVEHVWDLPAAAQELRIFRGANLQGTVPDETLTGVAEGASADEIKVGLNNSVASWSWDLDDDRLDTGIAWIGPSVTTGVITPEPATTTVDVLEAMLVADRGHIQYDRYWADASSASLVRFVTDVGADLFAVGDTTIRRGNSEVWSLRHWRPVFNVDPAAYVVVESWNRAV